MFQVQFLCPRQSIYWQDLTEPFLLFFSRPRVFSAFAPARSAALALIFRYHAVRVIDGHNRVVFEA